MPLATSGSPVDIVPTWQSREMERQVLPGEFASPTRGVHHSRRKDSGFTVTTAGPSIPRSGSPVTPVTTKSSDDASYRSNDKYFVSAGPQDNDDTCGTVAVKLSNSTIPQLNRNPEAGLGVTWRFFTKLNSREKVDNFNLGKHVLVTSHGK